MENSSGCCQEIGMSHCANIELNAEFTNLSYLHETSNKNSHKDPVLNLKSCKNYFHIYFNGKEW